MAAQQIALSLAGFELPVEEFVEGTIDNVNSSYNLHIISAAAGRSSGQWRRTKTLGRGSCGHVWLQERDVDMPGPRARAVKEVALSELSRDGIDPLNEISAMDRVSKLKHGDFAVFGEFYGYAMNSSTLFLAMEYFPHRDLKKHIEARKMDEREAKKVIHDILVGLKTMHAEGLVHRDLKPENIFVASKPPECPWSVKIADFGLSKRIPPEQQWNLTPHRGTRYYTAPEVEGLIDPCQEKPGAMDMWSLGIMVYYLATRQFPFTPREVSLFCRNDGKFPFPRRPILEQWSEEGLAFAEALLKPSPRDRLSAESALQHPWITSMGQEWVGLSCPSTLSTSVVPLGTLEMAERDLATSSRNTMSENIACLPVAEALHIQLPLSVWPVRPWSRPPQAIPYADQATSHSFSSPLERRNERYTKVRFVPNSDETMELGTVLPCSVASPRPLSPLRISTAPVSHPHEVPPASFYDSHPPDFSTASSRPGRHRQTISRRATAPAPLWLVEDAIDKISPRSRQTEPDGPIRLEWPHDCEASDIISSTQEMSVIELLDPPPSPPPQSSTLIWRETQLSSFHRSFSDSLVPSSYRLDRSISSGNRSSVLEFVTNPRFSNSVNTLYHAIRGGRPDVVDQLLHQGVEIETVFRDPPDLQYGTALHLAVSCGQAETVALLLRRGASVSAKAKAELFKFQMRWLEPLHLAAYHGLQEIARMLLDQGARIEANALGNFTNKEKRTPLHLAVLGDDSDEIPRMVRLLLDYGANPEVKDDLGMKPGDYAVMLKQESLRRYLPPSSSSKLKARVVKMRIKFGPFALAGPLMLGAAGVALSMK